MKVMVVMRGGIIDDILSDEDAEFVVMDRDALQAEDISDKKQKEVLAKHTEGLESRNWDVIDSYEFDHCRNCETRPGTETCESCGVAVCTDCLQKDKRCPMCTQE
jgi:hypothetical protein